MSPNRIVIAAVGIALVVAAVVFNSKRRTVDATTAEVENAIGALDPVSRAAVIARLAATPLAMAGVQVGSAVLGAFLLSEVGRVFGGTGRFPDALLAVGWIEAVMIVLQLLQLVLTVVLPPLGALVGIGTLWLSLPVLVALFAVPMVLAAVLVPRWLAPKTDDQPRAEP